MTVPNQIAPINVTTSINCYDCLQYIFAKMIPNELDISNLLRKLEEERLRATNYLNQIQLLKSQLSEKDIKIHLLERQNQQLRADQILRKDSRIPDRDVFSNYDRPVTYQQPVQCYTDRAFISLTTSANLNEHEIDEKTVSVRQKMNNFQGVKQKTITDLFNKRKDLNSNQIQSNKFLSPAKEQNSENYFKLFQSFLVISADLKKIEEDMVSAALLFSYPNNKKGFNPDTQRVIKLYCYPRNIKLIERNKEELNSIFQSKEYQTSVFIINSQYTTMVKDRSQGILNEALQSINPNYYLFGTCVKVRSVVKHQNFYFEVPKTYVVLSYFPFVSFFLSILKTTIGLIRGQELQTKIADWNLETNVIKTLQELSKLQISHLPVNLRFKCQQQTQNLSIPQRPFTDNLILEYSLPCLAKLDCDMFVDIFVHMLLEYSLVIYSSDSNLLSQTILLFMYLIRPFCYPFLIIFDLPDEMQYMLDSPFPVILGITAHKPVQKQSLNVYFNLNTMKVERKPDLSGMIHCVNYFKSCLKGKFGNNNQVLKKMKYIINEDIIAGLKKDKQTLMTPFLKVFKESQIYKNYQQ